MSKLHIWQIMAECDCRCERCASVGYCEAERDAMCAALQAMSDHGGEDADTHELRHRNDGPQPGY